MVLAKRSKGQILDAAYVLPQVLVKPTAIYEGLCWDDDEERRGVGWRCYAGIPDCSYREDGTKQPPWAGDVFLAFVNSDGVIYNWRWEKSSPDDPTLPRTDDEIKPRFRKRLL